MKNKKVTLAPLTANDREQFILDNQWAFKYGALEEFGRRDDHVDGDGELSREKPLNIAWMSQATRFTVLFLTVKRLAV